MVEISGAAETSRRSSSSTSRHRPAGGRDRPSGTPCWSPAQRTVASASSRVSHFRGRLPSRPHHPSLRSGRVVVAAVARARRWHPGARQGDARPVTGPEPSVRTAGQPPSNEAGRAFRAHWFSTGSASIRDACATSILRQRSRGTHVGPGRLEGSGAQAVLDVSFGAPPDPKLRHCSPGLLQQGLAPGLGTRPRRPRRMSHYVRDEYRKTAWVDADTGIRLRRTICRYLFFHHRSERRTLRRWGHGPAE